MKYFRTSVRASDGARFLVIGPFQKVTVGQATIITCLFVDWRRVGTIRLLTIGRHSWRWERHPVESRD